MSMLNFTVIMFVMVLYLSKITEKEKLKSRQTKIEDIATIIEIRNSI